MSYLAPYSTDAAHADSVAVGAASAQFTNIVAMAAGEIYVLVANVDLWYKQGANPTASAAAGSVFLPARATAVIDGSQGVKLAVIQDSTGGKASLCRARVVR